MLKLLNNWPAKLLSFLAAVLLFFFNRTLNQEEITLTVKLNVRLRNGFTISAPYKDKILVSISGDREEDIRKISEEDFEVYADLRGDQYNKNGKYLVKLQYEKKIPDSININLNPLETEITIETSLDKSVEIIPIFTNSVREGYKLVHTKLSPSVIQIFGPQSQINKIDKIKTEEINLKDYFNDFVVRVRLQNPGEFIKINSDPVIDVIGKIEDFQITDKFTDIPIKFINLDEKFIQEFQKPAPVMEIKSSQNLLDRLTTENLEMLVDCSRVKYQGKYVLETSVKLDDDYEVISYEPKSLIVDFILKKAE